MRQKIRLLIFVAVAFVLALLAGGGIALGGSGDGNGSVDEAVPPTAEYYRPDFYSGELRVVAETEVLALYFNENTLQIAVLDKRDGKLYLGAVSEEEAELAYTSEQQRDIMRCLLTVKYTTKDADYLQAIRTTTLYTERDMLGASVSYLEDGFSLSIVMRRLGLGFTLSFRIKGDRLVVAMPADTMTETMNNAVLSVEIMPFLMSAPKGAEGYLLLPDGSGAIHRFEDGEKLSNINKKLYTYTIYGGDSAKLQNDNKTWHFTNEAEINCFLPIMGIHVYDRGIFAMITKGADHASVNALCVGTMVDYARIYPSFTVRGIYSPLRSQVGAGSGSTSAASVFVVQKEPNHDEKEVEYVFMPERGSDYGAMASVYRAELRSLGLLNASKLLTDDAPAVFDIFMGTTEKGFPFDKFVTTATFRESERIIRELGEMGIRDVTIRLMGWNKGGYGRSPQPFSPEGRLGGVKGLRGFLSAARSLGTGVILDYEALGVRTGVISVNFGKNRLVDATGIAVTNDAGNRYLYSPLYAAGTLMDKAMKKATGWDVGVGLEAIGSLVVRDYNKKYAASRAEVMDAWSSMVEKSAAQGIAGVTGGNLYVLEHADLLFDIPYTDSNLVISSESIPFYHMVVHGSVPYTGTPLNLMGDRSTFLKCVAYGYVPYFRVTWSPVSKLIMTDYSWLYSGEFNDISERISSICLEYRTKMGGLTGEDMLSFERLADDVYKTVYLGGSVLYVNATDASFRHDGVEIPADDYIIVKGG